VAERATDASAAPAERAADGSTAREEVSSSGRPTGEERRRAPAGGKEGEERRCAGVGGRREGGRGTAVRGDRREGAARGGRRERIGGAHPTGVLRYATHIPLSELKIPLPRRSPAGAVGWPSTTPAAATHPRRPLPGKKERERGEREEESKDGEERKGRRKK
jgi:hypothetical protein